MRQEGISITSVPIVSYGKRSIATASARMGMYRGKLNAAQWGPRDGVDPAAVLSNAACS